MTVVHDITTKICANCGKDISILHPDHWAYKRVMKKEEDVDHVWVMKKYKEEAKGC